MLPVVKIWGLPTAQSEEALKGLHQRIVKSAVGIEELEIKDENGLTVFFVPDLMIYGLGREIVVEVIGVPVFGMDRMIEIELRSRFARELRTVLSNYYPDAEVVVFVYGMPENAAFSSTINYSV